jgi:hypothetical protein
MSSTCYIYNLTHSPIQSQIARRWVSSFWEPTAGSLTVACPPVHMNNVQLPCEDHVKYLGLHLDRKLTWQHHIFTKRKHLGVTLIKMCCLLGRKSQLSLSNKLLL